MHLRVHLALFTVAVLFSVNYVISKLAMNAFHPLAFAYLRILGSAIVMQFVLPRDRAPMTKADSRALIGFAMLAVVLNQTSQRAANRWCRRHECRPGTVCT